MNFSVIRAGVQKIDTFYRNIEDLQISAMPIVCTFYTTHFVIKFTEFGLFIRAISLETKKFRNYFLNVNCPICYWSIHAFIRNDAILHFVIRTQFFCE